MCIDYLRLLEQDLERHAISNERKIGDTTGGEHAILLGDPVKDVGEKPDLLRVGFVDRSRQRDLERQAITDLQAGVDPHKMKEAAREEAAAVGN